MGRGWDFFQIKGSIFLSPSQQPYVSVSEPPPQSNLESDVFDLSNKVSPSVLLIIIILAIIFFVSGLLHLLVRFLIRPTSYRDPDDSDNVTALQGQLQQLFHLHDAGVDQTFIDTLPVFLYKAIIGLKKYPFDCAVCLCEFESEDKLRLLPKCSHAFHMECIDTWLLSHSTCPLCRTCLLSDFSSANDASSSPILLLLESGSESSREICNIDREAAANVIGGSNSVLTTNSRMISRGESNGIGSLRFDVVSRKSCEIVDNDDGILPETEQGSGEKVVTVKLGKFKTVVDIGEGSSNGYSSSTTNEVRRCYSMGSFEYVMDDNSSLQVPIRTPIKKQSSKKQSFPLRHGHRLAMSECDCESRRDFQGLDSIKVNNRAASIVASSSGGSSSSNNNNNSDCIKSKRESFSISKIWARSKKDKKHGISSDEDNSRRAFSFRFPVSRSGDENGRSSEVGFDVENQRCSNINNILECEAKTPSFARKTLQWLVGRQSKVVHSSLAPNV